MRQPKIRSLYRQGGWIQLAAMAVGAGASMLAANKTSKAAKSAAATQSASADRAMGIQETARQEVRSDLAPFRQAGEGQLPALQSLVGNQQNLTDPANQMQFIKDNPFYKLLADDAQSRLLKNQAARGKVGSGGTAEALQNSLLLLGSDLINNQFNQQNMAISNTMGITTLGQNAAAGQGTATMNTANNIGDLTTQQGNVNAAGQVGAANATAQGINSAIDAATGIYALAPNRQAVNPALQPVDMSTIPARR